MGAKNNFLNFYIRMRAYESENKNCQQAVIT